MEWEQAQIDKAVSDVFGFHALQLGLSAIDGLRNNRIKHRWLALDESGACAFNGEMAAPSSALHCDFEALPLPSHSMDLVVMPHTLDMAQDAHQVLREVERVLVPDGRVVIIGFNPASLWAMRRRPMPQGDGPTLAAAIGEGGGSELIGYWRLRDWLKLLSLEVQTGCFGCYRPLIHSPQWFSRLAWMDKAGDRWWPVFGAVYFLVAVKRVRGMHLVGKLRKIRKVSAAAPVVVTRRQP